MSGVHRVGCWWMVAQYFVGKIYSLIVLGNFVLPK